jgi:hypothetical protein
MSTPKIIKKDPYAALVTRSLILFITLRFTYLLGPCNLLLLNGSSITKDPFLRYYRTNEVIPAVSMALFAGHIVDQKEKKSLLVKCILAFSVISLFFIDMAGGRRITRYKRFYILSTS